MGKLGIRPMCFHAHHWALRAPVLLHLLSCTPSSSPQMFVAMLREAIENDHVVFAFKSMILLKILVENGGRAAANRFVKASGMHIVVPLMVSLLAKVSFYLRVGSSQCFHN